MPLSIQGSPSGNLVEVAANTLAMRVNERPMNVGAFGSYSLGCNSLIIAAGLGGNSPVFSMRSAAPAGPNVLVRRFMLAAVSFGSFTAGSCLFQLFVARAYTASDTNGTALTLTTNNMKRRTSFGTTAIQDARFSTTGVTTAGISAGTRTLDATPVASLFGEAPNAGAATSMAPPTDLLRYGPESWPMLLAPNEGLVLQATAAAAGTWSFSVEMDWDEVASTEI